MQKDFLPPSSSYVCTVPTLGEQSPLTNPLVARGHIDKTDQKNIQFDQNTMSVDVDGDSRPLIATFRICSRWKLR